MSMSRQPNNPAIPLALALVLAFMLLEPTRARAVEWQAGAGFRWAAITTASPGKTGFRELPAAETGIRFTNSLPEARYLANQILLNGSGVAAGDVDGDGWCDLFLAGIDRPSVLYRNLGNWRFGDVTSEAGSEIACAGQASSGAVFADVDGDRDLDLLVNGVGRGTRLFLNDGKGHFREATAAWGLRGGTGGMSLALADIDGDGWLDLYAVNYRSTTLRDELEVRFKAAVTNNQYEILSVNGRPVTEPDLVGRYTVDPARGLMENGEADMLYRNSAGGKFLPVSWTEGSFLDEDGKPARIPYDWGLSAMFRDINGDGAPDLFVCNDFQSPDRFWLNDGRGRFRAIPPLALRQTSLFSMGADFADLDRDGHDDLFVADMLSRLHANRQVQLMDRPPMVLPLGAIENRPQYSRNMLFWNRGDGTFAEIAQHSGVEASEWCWCPVFLDVDLDGYEDLLCVTGHLRDAQNIDISRQIETMKRGKRLSRAEQLGLRKQFLPLDVPNFAFRNRGNRTFEECGEQWGFNSHRVSQGIALADLDNDGDLDAVINCLNDGPLVLRNETSRPRVGVRLRGGSPNTLGIGARITVRQEGLPAQSQEVICGGRYLSGDDPMRVFAAAGADREVVIEVIWRNGGRSRVSSAKPNRIYEIDEVAADPGPAATRAAGAAPSMFADVSGLIQHRHQEELFDDYQRQPLLPHKLSQLGPGISWCDLNDDGWEDLVIPGGRGGGMAAFTNDSQGKFAAAKTALFERPAEQDQTAVLGLPGADGTLRLLVGESNYEAEPSSRPMGRVLEARGGGIPRSLPANTASAGPLAFADVDADGRLELFAGGRVVPGRFPEPADSLFLRERAGEFEIDGASGAFARLGLVSGAVWSDLNGDGFPELVLACEAGPVRVFQYERGRFRELTAALGLARFPGLWNSVTAGDFDGDGRLDIAAGNWGANTKYQSCLAQPIRFYYGESEGSGTVAIVESYFAAELGKIVPWRDWETLSQSLPFIRERYQSFTQFSTASVAEFMGGRMSGMREITITTLDSMLFLNRGDHFEARPLPFEAQLAPIFGVAAGDLDGDGNEDLVASQNFFGVPPLVSRLDGGRGVWLRGDGGGGFTAVPGSVSGIGIYGEGRGVALCDYDHDGRVDLAVAQNANATKLYRNAGGKPGLRVRLQGPPGNPPGIGAVLRLQRKDGRLGPAREIHGGAGYWSQDACAQVLGGADEAAAVVVKWPGGRETKTAVPPGAGEVCVRVDGGAG
jgi:hypothetical protein